MEIIKYLTINRTHMVEENNKGISIEKYKKIIIYIF